MITKIRSSLYTKVIALILIPTMFSPNLSFGSSGSVDPNLVSMESSEMVNVSSGDFSYSIPLLQVGGYPINLSYDANVTMEQAASSVGLGWNISTGAINRTVRGLPDDFNGDKVTTTMNLRPNLSITNTYTLKAELIGQETSSTSSSVSQLGSNATSTTTTTTTSQNSGALSVSFGTTFDNYIGNEVSFGVNASGNQSSETSSTTEFSGIFDKKYQNFIQNQSSSSSSFGLSAGATSSSRSGLSTNLGSNLSLGKNGNTFKLGLGLNHNTLHGSSLNYDFGLTKDWNVKLLRRSDKSRGIGGSFPFASKSYVPTANFDFTNKAYHFDIDLGFELWGVFPHVKYARSKYQNCLTENTKSEAAYGYLNLENAYDDSESLQDFNLSLPSIHEEIEIINTPIPTYDYFTSSTTGDMYRAIRNDAGYVRDPQSKSKGQAPSISGEAGPAPTGFNVGVNLSYSWNNNTTGEWKDDNPYSAGNQFQYANTTPNTNAQAKYEPFTFQKVNNSSTLTVNQLTALHGGVPLHQGIYKESGKIKGDGFFATDKNDVTTYDVTNNTHYQNDRRDRNVIFQYLTNRELRGSNTHEFLLYPENDHNYNNTGQYISTSNSRIQADYPDHHLGEITIISAGGSREIYGIPVMNENDQVSFNMSAYNNYTPGNMDLNRTIDDMGLVEYDPITNKDNSIENKRGNNFYFLRNQVPRHATSYLLTEILSANYADMGNDGPTPDDLGDYVMFNYSDLGKTKYRYPYQRNKATFNEGFKSNELDDMGSYQYGQRDAYLIHSIESKDYIAEFRYRARLDGYDVSDENGGISNTGTPDIDNKTRQLEQIKLYTRKGKQNGEGPIKTVHFVYDYSLCLGTPDNVNTDPSVTDPSLHPSNSGKLTLKEVYFTNFNSPKGKLHSYRFDYGQNEDQSDPNYAIDNAINNPPYNLSHKDRWGNYKDDNQVIDFAAGSSLDNNEYPYAQQNLMIANQEVQAWKLKAIDLPSGARMEVEYEADSYEFIQNKEATRMYSVSGYHSWEHVDGYFPNTTEFDEYIYDSKDDNRFALLVDLEEQITASTQGEARLIFEKEFLPEYDGVNSERYLYYNALLNLAPHKNNVQDPSVFDYVQGYGQIKAWYMIEEVGSSGVYDRAIIEFEGDEINAGKNKPNQKVHPLSRKAWQVINETLPLVMFPEDDLEKIYNKDNLINCGIYDDLEEGEQESDLSDASKNQKKNWMSYPNIYHMMLKTAYGSRAVPGKSWVRLRCGNTSKIGGGHRVKSIKVFDNWDQFVVGESSSVYGTEYDYSMTDARGNTVSSGVASYEPLNGGDEIALRHPHFYIHKGKSVPNERFYTELPINEEIYGTTDIRYAEVKVSSIDYAGLTLNKPGYTKFCHYTAKDYPLQLKYTRSDKELKKPGVLGGIGYSKRRFGLSHGMSVIGNDMHGKFKGKYVYSEPTAELPEGNQIYKEEHFYKEDATRNLNSLIPVIHKDGSKSNQVLGMNLDLMTHLNKAENNNSTVKLDGNLEFNFPGVIPSLWPGAQTSEISTYSSLTTKVVYQSGILEKVVVDDNGRYKSVTNLLYDAKTGSPITTEVSPEAPNELGNGAQKLYEYNYPAHWAYTGVEIASENINISRDDILDGNGYIISTEKQYYHPGDVLHISKVGTAAISIATVIEDELTNNYFLVDENGNQYIPSNGLTHSYRVFLPGRKNVTIAPMAQVTTLDTYPSGSSSPYEAGYNHTQVINLSGIELYERAKLEGSCFEPEEEGAQVVLNPYRYNLLGQWKKQNSYVYDGERDYESDPNTGLRFSRSSGLLSEYQPFWKNEGGIWLPIHDNGRSDYDAQDPLQNWIHSSETTLFDQYGHAKESEDVLGIKSATYMGYNQQHLKASVSNSRYEESGFDGFEDYYSDGALAAQEEGDPIFQNFDCINDHFRIETPFLSTEEAHTGKYSFRGLPSQTIVYQSEVWDGVESPPQAHGVPYEINAGDQVSQHRFVNENEKNPYVLMAWVKEVNNSTPQLTTYNAGLQVVVNGSVISATETRSDIINGWQRIELQFNIDVALPDGTPVEIQLIPSDRPLVISYFDDIRVHPYDSEMEAQVIDAVQQRPMATLDNRNFATVYQYDEEGNLVRTIQETERGKQTISENRTGVRIYK